jgi:hypothetical protein
MQKSRYLDQNQAIDQIAVFRCKFLMHNAGHNLANARSSTDASISRATKQSTIGNNITPLVGMIASGPRARARRPRRSSRRNGKPARHRSRIPRPAIAGSAPAGVGAGMLGERHEAAGRAIQRVDLPRRDVIDPAVEGQPVLGEARRVGQASRRDRSRRNRGEVRSHVPAAGCRSGRSPGSLFSSIFWKFRSSSLACSGKILLDPPSASARYFYCSLLHLQQISGRVSPGG